MINQNFYYLLLDGAIHPNIESAILIDNPEDSELKEKLKTITLQGIANTIYNDVLGLDDPTDRYFKVLALLCVLNTQDDFINITKDVNNFYKNNISKIYLEQGEDLGYNYRNYLNNCIDNIEKNKSDVFTFLNAQNLLDAYIGSMSDIERLGFLICAVIKAIDAEVELIYGN